MSDGIESSANGACETPCADLTALPVIGSATVKPLDISPGILLSRYVDPTTPGVPHICPNAR